MNWRDNAADQNLQGLAVDCPGPPVPADPPGLDAAIEAAAIGYDEAVNTALGNPPGSVFGEVGRSLWAEHPAFIAAVRAAAPALRAGALREAADEWKRQHQHLGAMAAYHWLVNYAERADRIGGAT